MNCSNYERLLWLPLCTCESFMQKNVNRTNTFVWIDDEYMARDFQMNVEVM